MSTPSRVLLLGHDATLLETRKWILERAGFPVCEIRSSDELERGLQEYQPDVMVICHTFSSADYAQAKKVVERYRPELKTVVLSTFLCGCVAEWATSVPVVPPHPLALITTVQRLLTEQPYTSTRV